MQERHDLQGYRVACLATNGVEQVELTEPRAALERDGARVDLISIREGQIQAVDGMDKAGTFDVDLAVADAEPDDYDALLLPGGVANPDKLRMDEDAVRFVHAFVESGRPVAAICHGPWMLVEAGDVRGRRLTSYPSLQTDVRNAGGDWVDEEVVVDRGIVTSRRPDDLPAFNGKMLEEFREGIHRRGSGRQAS